VKWWYLVALCLIVPIARAVDRVPEGRGWTRARAIAAALIAAAAFAALPAIDLRTPLAISALAGSVIAGLLAAKATDRRWLPWTVALSLALAHLPLVLALVDRMPRTPGPLAGGRVYERVTAEAHPVVLSETHGRTRDFFRRATPELWAVAGGIGGIGYAFDRDPDGSYFDGDRAARKRIDDQAWPERAPELRRAGVRYVVTDEPLRPPFRHLRRQGVDASLYELDAPAPTVRVDAETGATGWVLAAREQVSRLEAMVEAPAPSVLVWTRTSFPAWRATVDGAPVTIGEADGHLVAVPVPAGAHRVVVWWPAAPVVIGFALAALGLLVTGGLAWRR
jgi:hypothetical protein